MNLSRRLALCAPLALSAWPLGARAPGPAAPLLRGAGSTLAAPLYAALALAHGGPPRAKACAAWRRARWTSPPASRP